MKEGHPNQVVFFMVLLRTLALSPVFLLEGTSGRNYDATTFSCLPSLSSFRNFLDPQSCPSQGCSHLRIIHAGVERPDLLAQFRAFLKGIGQDCHWVYIAAGPLLLWQSCSRPFPSTGVARGCSCIEYSVFFLADQICNRAGLCRKEIIFRNHFF